jgi:hypothetical protein
MEALETYASVLSVLSVALMFIVAGMAKKQVVWKPVRRRRRS